MYVVTLMFVVAATNTLISQVTGAPVIPLSNQKDPAVAEGDGLTAPLLHLFLLEKAELPRPAVIVCPGGGYHGLAIDYEGVDVARWLNGHGVSAFVLEYRVSPHRHPAPIRDAQTALRLVRANAAAWNIDPERVGMLGFSAGGHLVSTAATHAEIVDPPIDDALKSFNFRPDFTVLIYPVISFSPPFGHIGCRDNLLGPDADAAVAASLNNDEQVTQSTPPAFLVHSSGDSVVSSENSVAYYLALLRAGIPAELHVYEQGEHGYGMGKGDPALSTWPGLCIHWMRKRGILQEE